ncbi:MAG: aspartyl protease family protein [Myxococcales bacterium]
MSHSLLLALALLAAPAAPAPTGPADPSALLAQARLAAGGSAWDAVKSVRSTYTIDAGGMKGTGDFLEDSLTGRFVNHLVLGPATQAEGFDGKTYWLQDASGQPLVQESAEAEESSANLAYRTSLAWYFPGRFPAQLEALPEQADGTRRFGVVRVTPKGGRTFELWLDSATHLIDRTVEHLGADTITTIYGDYREVQGVRIPFLQRSGTGDPKYEQVQTLTKVELNVPVSDESFAVPKPPKPDFTLAKGKTSTVVPFALLNNHLYVDVRLNGRGPYRFLLDTGASNIVTTALAKELGLKTEGAFEGKGVGEKSDDIGLAMVDSVQLGEATFEKQLFAVWDMAELARVEGTRAEGIVGYEVFRRLVATLDYQRGKVTFTLPKAFAYRGKGTVVPFIFNGQIPQVDGAIDGLAGKFDLDTGSRSSLDLMKEFIEKHGLRERYPAKVQGVAGWGIGGPGRSAISRAQKLELGKVAVPAPVVELTLQEKGGFVNPYVAGNVGNGVFKRFTVVFDYSRQQVIFEPNAAYAAADTFDRSGLWLNRAEAGFEIIDVYAGSPAAEAGLKAGEIVVGVDGKSAPSLELPALRQRLRTDKPGTRVKLKVRAGEVEREAVLVLRDLV